MKRNYIVVMIRKNVEGKLDYLQPLTYACGNPRRFSLEQATAEITAKIDGCSYYEFVSGFLVFVGEDLTGLKLKDFAQRLRGAHLQPTHLPEVESVEESGLDHSYGWDSAEFETRAGGAP
jgi:hypothetical protein